MMFTKVYYKNRVLSSALKNKNTTCLDFLCKIVLFTNYR